MAVTLLPERKAWQALKRHHAEIAGRTCASCSPPTPGGASG